MLDPVRGLAGLGSWTKSNYESATSGFYGGFSNKYACVGACGTILDAWQIWQIEACEICLEFSLAHLR